MRWDIFCKVIDNFGDIGVCWRLACDLAARGVAVRLWVDDATALTWMAPRGRPGVTVLPWPQAESPGVQPGDVVVETFGCDLPASFLARMASATPTPRWVNLEYLSAEAYVERSHGLPSPVLSGPAAGLGKWFFYPGFTPATGGLLREPGLDAALARFDRMAWLQAQGLAWQGERLVSLFCYEPHALPALLARLQSDAQPTRLLVTAGRATAAVRALVTDAGVEAGGGSLVVSHLPWLSQTDFDHLLWACDLNFVRGEDSLVRALWAGQAMVWQAYPQNDLAHHVKLQAWMDCLQAPASLRQWHAAWNGADDAAPPALDLPAWRASVQGLGARLHKQDDLTSQLLGFVRQIR